MLRLVRFRSSSAIGRLEIFLKGEWGTVCSDGFGSVEANIACRKLGYTSSTFLTTVGQLG